MFFRWPINRTARCAGFFKGYHQKTHNYKTQPNILVFQVRMSVPKETTASTFASTTATRTLASVALDSC